MNVLDNITSEKQRSTTNMEKQTLGMDRKCAQHPPRTATRNKEQGERGLNSFIKQDYYFLEEAKILNEILRGSYLLLILR